MEPQARVSRFNKIAKLRFGPVINEKQKSEFMNQLLPYETAFAENQHSIGAVT